jgi:hypothetical protein
MKCIAASGFLPFRRFLKLVKVNCHRMGEIKYAPGKRERNSLQKN